jgi:hypothetical protein
LQDLVREVRQQLKMYLSLVDCWLLVVVRRVSNSIINEKKNHNEMTMTMPGNLTARRKRSDEGKTKMEDFTSQ